MTDKIKLAKGVAKFVISTSVGSIITKGIKQHITTSNPVEQTQMVVGAYVVGAMIGDRALDWADSKFDDAAKAIQKFKSEDEESTTEE